MLDVYSDGQWNHNKINSIVPLSEEKLLLQCAKKATIHQVTTVLATSKNVLLYF